MFIFFFFFEGKRGHGVWALINKDLLIMGDKYLRGADLKKLIAEC